MCLSACLRFLKAHVDLGCGPSAEREVGTERATGVALKAAEEALAAVVAVAVTRQAAAPLLLLSPGLD